MAPLHSCELSVILFDPCREQEKAETKDKKVLAILKEKDNNIKILEEVTL